MSEPLAPPPANAAFRAIVRGRVQGVGFRYSTASCARELGVHGWVANQADGTVEVEALGARSVLDAFLAYLREGPRAARVSAVDVTWRDADGSNDDPVSGFEVR